MNPIDQALAPFKPRDPNLREGPRIDAWPTDIEALCKELRVGRERIRSLETALEELHELVDDYVDVVDGEDGQPMPNMPMRVQNIIDAALGRRPAP
jgi:hypothetical protein